MASGSTLRSSIRRLGNSPRKRFGGKVTGAVYDALRLSLYWWRVFSFQQPKSIYLELSNRCNLRCPTCWFHGENGIGNRYAESEMSTEEIFGIVDQLKLCGCRIDVGGAEPFVRNDLMKILTYIKESGIRVSLTTNGTLLDAEKIGALVDLGVDAINFSIDGYESLHDQIRGKDVFRKATTAIAKLKQTKQKEGKDKPVICVNITISKANLGHLHRTVLSLQEATGDGADFYRLHHLWYITQGELVAHQRVIREVLNCSACGAAGHFLPGSSPVDRFAVAAEVRSLSMLPKITMYPKLDYQDVLSYYSEGHQAGKRCLAPFSRAVIKPNGDVKFCPDEWIDDYLIGNVRRESINHIWNNSKSKKFRIKLLKHRSFPACKRCDWMYPL